MSLVRHLRTHFRLLHTTSTVAKGNKPRLQVRTGGVVSAAGATKATSRRESVAKMRADAVRARWEADAETSKRLAGLRPPDGLNIYFANAFEKPLWPLSDAVAMMREAAAPEMFDCLENPLCAKMTLNQRTKKATKFIAKVETSVTLPHQLDFLPKRRIIVLTNDPTVAAQCTNEFGAIAAGASDVLGRLETGGFHWDEYDDVVAHSDFSESLNRLRKTLHNRLPTLKNGRMGDDVVELLRAQQVAIPLESTPVEGVPEINELQVVLGQLKWEDSHLEANLKCYLKAIEAAKSSRLNGDIVERVEILCPPCDEVFLLDVNRYLAPSDKEKVKKTKTDKVEEEEEEEVASA